MAMMLPRVANAVDVTESDVNITTPDGTADCYFVHPASGTAPGVLVWPDIFGLRPAFRQMGKRLAESGYAVLVVNPFYRTKKAPTAAKGGGDADREVHAARAGAERDDAHDRREGVRRLARSAVVGRQEPQDRHAGLLHGRADRVPHRGGHARPRRRRRHVPRRRPRHRRAEQPAPAGREEQGAVPRSPSPTNDDQRSPTDKNVSEGDVREGEAAGGNRSVRRRGARLVPARLAASTTSRRPRRRGAACSCSTARRWPSGVFAGCANAKGRPLARRAVGRRPGRTARRSVPWRCAAVCTRSRHRSDQLVPFRLIRTPGVAYRQTAATVSLRAVFRELWRGDFTCPPRQRAALRVGARERASRQAK